MAPLDIAHSASASRTQKDARRPKLKATAADVGSWFAVAAAGDAFEYHRGVLAMDCAVGSRLSDDDRKELARIAKAALALLDAEKVHLVQRRLGAGEFSYICIARHKREAGVPERIR